MSSGVQRSNLQERWSAAVAEACRVASLDGEDQRPHLYDEVMKKHLLVDTGSAVTAWPPDPGDKPDPTRSLRAVNGSRLKCYGTKEVVVKIGRKQFKFTAIKADVSSPILGWDFIRRHKLSFVWNRWGDILIRHRKSGIKKVLEFKPLPEAVSESLSSLFLEASEMRLRMYDNFQPWMYALHTLKAILYPKHVNIDEYTTIMLDFFTSICFRKKIPKP